MLTGAAEQAGDFGGLRAGRVDGLRRVAGDDESTAVFPEDREDLRFDVLDFVDDQDIIVLRLGEEVADGPDFDAVFVIFEAARDQVFEGMRERQVADGGALISPTDDLAQGVGEDERLAGAGVTHQPMRDDSGSQ